MTYQTADYTETPQYNGNIASLSWRAPLGTCRDIQGYHFTYDAANRLKAASFWERTSGAPTINDKYSEPLINYDLNGNITQYQRRGLTTGTTYDQIDLMVYTYDAANPDRLSRIADLAPSASRPYGFKPKGVPSYYGYDNAGNMTSDGHKDLTVAYNALNLPDVFTFANVTPNNKIEIVYNAAGEKLEKQVYTGATLSLHKRYVMGIEYTGTALEAIYYAGGRIVPMGGGVFRYEYTLKDHLGNSRVSFAANGSSIQLLQENHYYPFGMEMKGAWIAQSGTENGYQYNGKELNEDWGLNWSDYGARWYDASVGRFPNIDPIIEKFPFLTPFNYASNNPITNIDLWGLQGTNFNIMTYWHSQGRSMFSQSSYQTDKAYEAMNGPRIGLAGAGMLKLSTGLMATAASVEAVPLSAGLSATGIFLGLGEMSIGASQIVDALAGDANAESTIHKAGSLPGLLSYASGMDETNAAAIDAVGQLAPGNLAGLAEGSLIKGMTANFRGGVNDTRGAFVSLLREGDPGTALVKGVSAYDAVGDISGGIQAGINLAKASSTNVARGGSGRNSSDEQISIYRGQILKVQPSGGKLNQAQIDQIRKFLEDQ